MKVRAATRSAVSVLCVLVFWSASPASGTAILPGINSPSRNISCLYVREVFAPHFVSLLCEIRHADYAQGLQKHCSSTYGVEWQGFQLDATGKGHVECRGGRAYDARTQRPRYMTLAYGKAWRQGAFTCLSQITGITCENKQGHGVFISRQSWRVW